LTIIEAMLHYVVMNIDPRKLLVLHAVVRHDGVQGAAQALHVSPSAISQQLMALENQCGVSLFDRSERKLRLTPAGESLASTAGAIDEALKEASRQLDQRQTAIHGRVTVGSLQSMIVAILAPGLRQIHEQHPALTVSVHEVADSLLIRKVQSGELDLALVEQRAGERLAKGLQRTVLANDPWRVVVPKSWASRSIKSLAAKVWISTFDDARADAFDALVVALGSRPNVVHRCVEFPSVLALVKAGAGAAIVPQLAIDLFGTNDIAVINVPGLGSRTITFVHRSTRHEPSVAVQAVMEVFLRPRD
jgi:DNA-binding transcriptional LysR family regulator